MKILSIVTFILALTVNAGSAPQSIPERIDPDVEAAAAIQFCAVSV